MTDRRATDPARHERGLAEHTVVVIGGSSGIGLETARRARAGGADVILTASARPGTLITAPPTMRMDSLAHT